MFQLPFLGQGFSASTHTGGVSSSAAKAGLAGLLESGDESLAVFGGELQAMLGQLPPAVLQRLEEMLAGGMSLPQAARSLLTDGAMGGRELFAQLLAETELGDAAVDPKSVGQAPRDGGFPQLLNLPLTGGSTAPDLPQSLATALQPLASPVGTSATQASPLPPQLASSLLDMVIPQQVGGRGWDSAVADRVMWMVQGEQQFAKLKLNPPNLGPIEVRLTVNQDQASVSFITQQAAVKEALEAALPRLREMFDQQSLQLVRADVSDPGAGHGSGSQGADGQGASGDGLLAGGDADPMEAATPVVPRMVDGLIDLFA